MDSKRKSELGAASGVRYGSGRDSDGKYRRGGGALDAPKDRGWGHKRDGRKKVRRDTTIHKRTMQEGQERQKNGIGKKAPSGVQLRRFDKADFGKTGRSAVGEKKAKRNIHKGDG